jgi:lysozyme
MRLLPPGKPKLSKPEAIQRLGRFYNPEQVQLLGIRGYYLNTMGEPKKNDRGLYDDAIFVVSPEVFAAFNANTDPSVFRKRIAVLELGCWSYKVGTHGLSKPKNLRYEALVQAGPVTVKRDEMGLDTGWFGINIHRGGYNTTSSEGCQTIYPEQWHLFIETVKAELKKQHQVELDYVLV